MKNYLAHIFCPIQQKKKQNFRQLLDKNVKYYNKVYDILVSIGARERMRDIFVNAHVTQDCREWRFESVFGTAKYLNQHKAVSPNFTSPEDKEKLTEINTSIKKIIK